MAQDFASGFGGSNPSLIRTALSWFQGTALYAFQLSVWTAQPIIHIKSIRIIHELFSLAKDTVETKSRYGKPWGPNMFHTHTSEKCWDYYIGFHSTRQVFPTLRTFQCSNFADNLNRAHVQVAYPYQIVSHVNNLHAD